MRRNLLDMGFAPKGLQPLANLGVIRPQPVLGDPDADDDTQMHICVSTVVTDGVFAPDGSFLALPALDDEPFEKLWQKKVFDLLLKHGKIDQSLVTQMLGAGTTRASASITPSGWTPTTAPVASGSPTTCSAARWVSIA